jgi:hypothetical protein
MVKKPKIQEKSETSEAHELHSEQEHHDADHDFLHNLEDELAGD